MRWLILLTLGALPAPCQHTLYTCMAVTREYVVGAKLLPSGLFQRLPSGEWRHAGYSHPFMFSMDYDGTDPSVLYLAAGNGLIRASSHGDTWKILTGSDVTEIRDVAVDRNAPGTLYFAYTRGLRVTRDGGDTWQELTANLPRKFMETIRIDRGKSSRLLAGGESGILASEDGGQTWKLAGAAGLQILKVEQSPHDACSWLAGTQGGGLFASTDCGQTFENAGRTGVGVNIYDIAFDPTNPSRIALATGRTGILVSGDGGKIWTQRNNGLPRPDVWSAAFDPDKPGRLYASVHEEAVYVSDNAGVSWTKSGLEGSAAYRLRFVPEKKPR